MFGSSRSLSPERTIVGEEYRFDEVVDPNLLPSHISFIWNGVNKDRIFTSFAKSNVYWAELDVRKDPISHKIVLKYSQFDSPNYEEKTRVEFQDMVQRIIKLDRGIKIVLKEDEGLLNEIIEILKNENITGNRVWFDLLFEVFHENGLNEIQTSFPKAKIMTRVDFLVPLLSQFPKFDDNEFEKRSE